MVNSRCKGKIFLEEYKKKNTKKTPSVDCCKSSKRKESFYVKRDLSLESDGNANVEITHAINIAQLCLCSYVGSEVVTDTSEFTM